MKGSTFGDDLRDLYQDLILDHGRHPRNFRALPGANREIVGHNPLCGDKLTLALIVGENGAIQDAAFQGSGCAISMASASMMTEMLKGKPLAEVRELLASFLALCTEGPDGNPTCATIGQGVRARLEALSGVRHYPMRVKCATLPWRALEAALDTPDAKSVKTE